MGFVNLASYWSRINGYNYYEAGNVLSVKKVNDIEYHALVKGSNDNVYEIKYIPDHPKKTTCSCPRANNKMVVCKHKVAVYFALNPEEALMVKKQREEELKRQEQLEDEFMERHNKRVEKATKYVESLTIEEMKKILISHKIIELEEFEEQFYEEPYEDDFY